MHAGVGACRNCRGRWAYFSHGNWCGRDPDSRGFFSLLRQFEARLQPPLRRSRVVPLHVLYMVESSPRYWPTGLLCTGSWGKCIASLALNAPQRQFVVVVVKRAGLVYSWDQGTHPLTRGRSLADSHTAHEYPPLIHAPYPLLLETPWPAAIKLAREPIPFRATSLTTPSVLSLDSDSLLVKLSPTPSPSFSFPLFSARSSLIHSTFAVGRLVLAPSISYSFLSVSCVFASPRRAHLGQNPRHARSLPTAPSTVRRHCRRRRRVALAAAAALSSYARSRYRLVIIFDNPLSLLEPFRAEPSPPRLDSTDRFSPPLAFFTTVLVQPWPI